MSHFRSKEMHLYKMCVAKDDAYRCIREMGELSECHFVNLNANCA